MPGGYQNLAGRVGAGHEVFEVSRDGTGWVGSGQEVFKYRGSVRVTIVDSI